MNQPEQYQAIEAAIVFLQENHRLPPSLEAVAAHVHLSPAGLQQLFGEWAGVGPGPFLHYLVPGRRWLPPPQAPLFAEAPAAGLSAPGRPGGRVTLHAMTPGEYGKGGQPLEISYTFSESPFGPLLAAATPRGLCYAGFADDPARAFGELQAHYPKAAFTEQPTAVHAKMAACFHHRQPDELPLHVKGTAFQLKVWALLLQLPEGGISTYGRLAHQLGQPGASRAVGTAAGDNPLAWLIPCHRVLQQGGGLGGYHWGTARKQAMLAREAARQQAGV